VHASRLEDARCLGMYDLIHPHRYYLFENIFRRDSIGLKNTCCTHARRVFLLTKAVTCGYYSVSSNPEKVMFFRMFILFFLSATMVLTTHLQFATATEKAVTKKPVVLTHKEVNQGILYLIDCLAEIPSANMEKNNKVRSDKLQSCLMHVGVLLQPADLGVPRLPVPTPSWSRKKAEPKPSPKREKPEEDWNPEDWEPVEY
jgi:hypothetical protein